MIDHHLRLDPAQIKALAAAEDGYGNLANFRGCEDEFDVLGRFFQRLQQGVEGVFRQHMHFVDDIDFVPRAGRSIVDRVNDLTNVIHPGAAGGVHFQDIDMTAFCDGDAGLTNPARVCCRAALAVLADAVQPLGDNPCGGGFAGAANASQDKGLGDPIGFERVFQRTHHCILTDQIGEGRGAVFARQYLIGLGRFAHVFPRIRATLAG